ncbi:hypothetical protein D3C73_1402830 [compost metagenome]
MCEARVNPDTEPVDGPEEQRMLVSERIVQASAVNAHPLHQLTYRRLLIPLLPEQLHS